LNAVMCEWLKNHYCVNVKVNGIESLKKNLPVNVLRENR